MFQTKRKKLNTIMGMGVGAGVLTTIFTAGLFAFAITILNKLNIINRKLGK
ncbi:hypothetical protein ACSU64_15630 [Bacillaceae bacterium C204]|uniref:hypothetical protein n=1 Tax=Neobacillus sp. 204 TaxID=3383351 RepID=UPI00397BC5DC